MHGILLSVLLSSCILFHVSGEIYQRKNSYDYASLYPFLEKWARGSHTKLLTVVFDDYERSRTFDVPRSIVEKLNVSVKIASMKHLISLKNQNPDHNYHVIDPGGCVLLLILDLNHLRDSINSPYINSFWQPENWYILQEQGQRTQAFDYLRFCRWAFERLWRFRRVYKVLLFAENKIIRYDPFDYTARHTKYVNSSCDWYCSKLDQENFLILDEPNATDVLDSFAEERISFASSPLKVSIFETTTMPFSNGSYSGLEYNYLEVTCSKMNVTPVLVQSRDKFGWKHNGAFFGTIGHLVYESADVSFNQFFVKDYFTRQMEFTSAISGDKLCVLVPKSPPLPDYLVIFKIFSVEVWLLIFAAQFVISAIYTMLNSKRCQKTYNLIRKNERVSYGYVYSDQPHFLRNQTDITFRIIPKAMGNEQCKEVDRSSDRSSSISKNSEPVKKVEKVEKHSKGLKAILLFYLGWLGKCIAKVTLQIMEPYEFNHPWFPQRLFLVCSLLLSLILNGVFTSQLASNFSKRMYYDDIDTLEELEESGLTILTTSRDILDDSLSYYTSPVIERLRMRLQYASDSEVQRRLFVTKDAGYLHRHSTVALKYNKDQREMLHVVQECPKDYILANVMTKGSPYRDRINSILNRLNSGGFYWKWYERLLQSQQRANRELHNSSSHRKVSIRHLSIPFAMLYAGLGTSVIVFIFEYRRNNGR